MIVDYKSQHMVRSMDHSDFPKAAQDAGYNIAVFDAFLVLQFQPTAARENL